MRHAHLAQSSIGDVQPAKSRFLSRRLISPLISDVAAAALLDTQQGLIRIAKVLVDPCFGRAVHSPRCTGADKPTMEFLRGPVRPEPAYFGGQSHQAQNRGERSRSFQALGFLSLATASTGATIAEIMTWASRSMPTLRPRLRAESSKARREPRPTRGRSARRALRRRRRPMRS